jgi:hypothetical protein
LDLHDKEGEVMKKLLVLALFLSFAVLSSGCGATPAYSAKERSRMISRNWNYQGKQLNDDVDHFLLQRGGGWMTIWNVHPSD